MNIYITAMALSLSLTGCLANKSTTDSNDSKVSDETLPDTAIDNPEPIVWSGPSMVFTKEDNADHTDPANQDTLTERVILTRSFQGALFNVVLEDGPSSTTPTGTEWAMGSTASLDELEFKTLKAAADNRMQDLPGKALVLHLTEEDIYLDVTFLSWSRGGSAGGFSYERNTPN